MSRVAKEATATVGTAAEAKVKVNSEVISEVVREPEPPKLEPCALDGAPIGSKVVIGAGEDGRKQARLITPQETIVLPLEDIANLLPLRAKVRKKMESVFEATELAPTSDRPALITSTARDAIARYRVHFGSA